MVTSDRVSRLPAEERKEEKTSLKVKRKETKQAREAREATTGKKEERRRKKEPHFIVNSTKLVVVLPRPILPHEAKRLKDFFRVEQSLCSKGECAIQSRIGSRFPPLNERKPCGKSQSWFCVVVTN